jgi:predicted permease
MTKRADRCATVSRVTAVHSLLGSAAIAMSLAVVGAALWSVIAAMRSDGRSDHRFAVDRAVLAVLLVLAAAGLVGMALLMSGLHPADQLHLVYGPAAIISVPVAIWIGARASSGRASRLRRDAWTAGGGIVLLGLGLRLFATG